MDSFTQPLLKPLILLFIVLSLARNLSRKPERQSLADNWVSDTCKFIVPSALSIILGQASVGKERAIWDSRRWYMFWCNCHSLRLWWLLSNKWVCSVVRNSSSCSSADNSETDGEDAQHVLQGSGSQSAVYQCSSECLHLVPLLIVCWVYTQVVMVV